MNKNILTLNEIDFEKTIKHSNKPVLVDFYALWCSPCKMQQPIIDELYNTLKDKVEFFKVNIDESEHLCELLNIESIPYIAIYYKGELVEKSVGLTSLGELSSMIIKYL